MSVIKSTMVFLYRRNSILLDVVIGRLVVVWGFVTQGIASPSFPRLEGTWPELEKETDPLNSVSSILNCAVRFSLAF